MIIRNEGIVVKDLLSAWVPDNRDGRWCKVKPDYVHCGSDLDLLIIGIFFLAKFKIGIHDYMHCHNV